MILHSGNNVQRPKGESVSHVGDGREVRVPDKE